MLTPASLHRDLALFAQLLDLFLNQPQAPLPVDNLPIVVITRQPGSQRPNA